MGFIQLESFKSYTKFESSKLIRPKLLVFITMNTSMTKFWVEFLKRNEMFKLTRNGESPMPLKFRILFHQMILREELVEEILSDLIIQKSFLWAVAMKNIIITKMQTRKSIKTKWRKWIGYSNRGGIERNSFPITKLCKTL